jgi:hypothetical protein
MKLIKLIAPGATIAMLAMFAPYAGAQTMGEYATATAGVASGGGTSMGSAIAASVSNTTGDAGGGSTWGASSLGGSFEERAGSASGSSSGDFESRAGSSGGFGGDSRWPNSGLSSVGGADRFSESGRFQDQDRFAGHSDLSSSTDRFPSGVLDQNTQGLDSRFSSSSGLDGHYSTSGELDSSYTNN